MKKIKVFHMGKRLKDIYPHATKFQVFKYKVRKFISFVLKLSVVALLGYGLFVAGSHYSPVVTYEKQEMIIKEIVQREAPVLDRIAGCESEGNRNSKGSHIGKDGQVRTNANTNKTVDIGKYQINQTVWGKKATELGLNLWVEEDNKKMAEWIYANLGTEPWYSSAKCWK